MFKEIAEKRRINGKEDKTIEVEPVDTSGGFLYCSRYFGKDKSKKEAGEEEKKMEEEKLFIETSEEPPEEKEESNKETTKLSVSGQLLKKRRFAMSLATLGIYPFVHTYV